MWRVAARCVLAAVLAAATAGARADEAAAWAALRAGGAVALVRHADAPGGFGDPPGFRLEDCSTQRNLSPRGRADAEAIGRRLKAEAIPIGRVVSSPWCRCVATATLLDAGRVHTEATFGNAVVWSDRRDALTAGARRIVAAWRGPGNLVVVTHGANVQALLGGANPASGEAVVVRRQGDGTLAEVGRIPPPATR